MSELPLDRLLFVYNKGGAPLEFALPAAAQVAEVHVLAFAELPQHTRHLWESAVTSIKDATNTKQVDLVDTIVSAALELGAGAVITLSEFALLAVEQAAARLGLRGAGPNVVRARDKRLMRTVWRDADVPIPDFRVVSTLDEVRNAVRTLRLPALLKAAWGAGSVAHMSIHESSEADLAWHAATSALDRAADSGFVEMTDLDWSRGMLVEEIIDGSTAGWCEPSSGYGDYLSVEGIVDEGLYHPLCITTRIPTIPPFTELSNLAPCEFGEEKQRYIEEVARRAVDALGLRTCGTHTELKLLADGSVSVIESAARLGGVNIARQLETVFGLNPVQMLVAALLGKHVEYPAQMLTRGQGAAGSLSIIATDAEGRPWQDRPRIWNAQAVDWSRLLSPGSTIEAVPGLSIPDGTPMPRYGTANGARDYAGLFFLTAPDAPTLVRDSYSVLNGLESALET